MGRVWVVLSLSVVLLVVGMAVDLHYQRCWSDLLLGAQSEDVPKIQASLKWYPWLVNSHDFRGSPLHSAARYGHLEAVRALCKAGADVNLVIPIQDSPLRQACAGNAEEVAHELIARGADVNLRIANRERATPLHWAAEMGMTGLVKEILAHKVDVNAAGKLGLTALHSAAGISHIPGNGPPSVVNGQDEVIRLLLEAGANRNAIYQYVDGMTAYDLAVQHKAPESILTLLRPSGPKQ